MREFKSPLKVVGGGEGDRCRYPQFLDLGIVEQTTVDKIVVEFLRINPFIRKAMPYLDFSDWTEAIGGYHHLPLEKKISLIRPLLESGKRVTVCEDVPSHYEYWREHVNPNRDDCCDLERR